MERSSRRICVAMVGVSDEEEDVSMIRRRVVVGSGVEVGEGGRRRGDQAVVV